MAKTRAVIRSHVESFFGRTDKSTLIDGIISDVLLMLSRDFSFREVWTSTTTLSVSDSAYEGLLPSDFVAMKRNGLRLYNGTSTTTLEYIPFELFRRRFPNLENETPSEPSHFTLFGNKFLLYPPTNEAISSSGTYTLYLDYKRNPSDATNTGFLYLDDVIQDFVLAEAFYSVEEYEKGALYEARAKDKLLTAEARLAEEVGFILSYDEENI